ncbi:MAG: hypothetical protein AAFV53_40250 [Myxococcota bacterium]
MKLFYANGPIHRPFRTQMEAAGMKETRDFLDDWDLYFPDYGTKYEDDMRALLPARIDQWIGGLPHSFWISNKANLWIALVREHTRPVAATIMPETWRVSRPPQRKRLLDIWTPALKLISKNPRLQRRQGLKLFDTPQQAFAAGDDGFIITQRLITDQLLVSGYRFHARMYLMVVIEGQKLSAWVHRIAKVIYTLKPAHEATGVDAWLTRSRGSHELPKGLPFTWEALKAQHPILDQQQVDETLCKMIQATSPKLQAAWGLACNPAFQFFGVDFLFGADGTPWLLECNKGPDMSAKCARDAAMKKDVIRDSLTLIDIPGLPPWPGGFRRIITLPLTEQPQTAFEALPLHTEDADVSG